MAGIDIAPSEVCSIHGFKLKDVQVVQKDTI